MARGFDEILRGVIAGLRTLETLRNREFLRELLFDLVELEQAWRHLDERAAALARRVAELEEKTALADRLVEKDGTLWRPGNEEPGPYCLPCWQEDRKLILLSTAPDGESPTCPRCRRRS